MIELNIHQWNDLICNNDLNVSTSPISKVGPEVAKIFKAKCVVPHSEYPWVVFEFNNPVQETFIRLKYL